VRKKLVTVVKVRSGEEQDREEALSETTREGGRDDREGYGGEQPGEGCTERPSSPLPAQQSEQQHVFMTRRD
jgi:hypothetical protein